MSEFRNAVTTKGQVRPCFLCEAPAIVVNRFLPPEDFRLRVPEIAEIAQVGKAVAYTLCRRCNDAVKAGNDYSAVENRLTALAITCSSAKRLRNAFTEIERLNHGRQKSS